MGGRLLLIDGHNLLFRMFYGMPDNFYTADGVKYNALYGFVCAMEKVMRMVQPTHVFVSFDSPDCGDRRELDEAYKANRPDYSEMAPEECPFTQLPAIYAALGRMNIPYAEIHGCEADDVIASYAVKYAGEYDVMIMSTDRDYWQLVSEKVSILNYHGYDSTLVTPQTVRQKYGVEPAQFADWKCLVGDKSDNIVGVPGVGPKNAAALLGTFGSLEYLMEHTDGIPRPAIRRAVEEAKERLLLNRKLILLDGNAPLPLSAEELRHDFTSIGDTVRFCMDCLADAVQNMLLSVKEEP
ncbi:MAG: 5'-3' exonuclease [Clostridia bacterium]|nr:5'-3' exonuclease [Clostridia bacterium]